jgi:hypothetical protein
MQVDAKQKKKEDKDDVRNKGIFNKVITRQGNG